jgi:hypothetical protein
MWDGRAHVLAAVYVGVLMGHTEEPSDAHLVSAIVSGGEGENVNLDGMHAETADHRECGAKERDAVVSSHEPVRLSSKTVTDPDFCS